MSATTMTKPYRDARFWNFIAKRYSRKPVPDQAVYETKLKKTNEYLRPDHQVLDIGCGTGTTAIHHAPHVAHILATDISAKMIDIAREKSAAAGVENVTFEVSSIADLEVQRAHYDVILAHSILHLVADVPKALRQLQRMLKPGGRLIASVPCIGDFAPWLGFIAPIGRTLGLLPRINVFREAEFLQWLADTGFEIDENWQPKKGTGNYIVAHTSAA